VNKLSEEHGHVSGRDVDSLQIGERVRFVPAHVCTTINLAHEVNVLCDDVVVEQWPIEARGCVR
jgi:D-serine deaminase-like pyridoxal phosphate-dependent protein